MRHLVKFLLGLIVLGLLAIVAVGGYVVYEANTFLKTPPELPGQDVVLRVERGETFDRVAYKLRKAGLITNVDYFRVLGQWKGQLGAIQAGEFELNTGWTPEQVLETLVSGKPRLHKLSLREGLTWRQTALEVEKAGFGSFEDFEKAIRDPELLARRHIPFDIAEGFLFPDTYLLEKTREPNARRVAEHLIEAFWKQAEAVWPELPEKYPSAEEIERVVTLASIVEREAAAPGERPKVAGVFANRLRIGMPLQSCVTVIYGLGDAFDGNLTKKHLEDKSNIFNTYTFKGLPPHPVCNPGLESLRAAAKPAEHKYLYFVARKDGTHQFSKTLAEHNKAVRKYQLK